MWQQWNLLSSALQFDCHSLFLLSASCSPAAFTHLRPILCPFLSSFPSLQHLQNPSTYEKHSPAAPWSAPIRRASLAFSAINLTTNDAPSAHFATSHLLCLLVFGSLFGLLHEVPVGLRAKEARIAVFGHEHVDFVLGRVKARGRQRQQVGFGDVTGFVVDVNLEGSRGREPDYSRTFLFFSSAALLMSRWIKPGPHLTGSIRADEFIIDLLGFDGQFGCRFGVPVILTGKVERDVLFTELRH